jgi:hypothetical protein
MDQARFDEIKRRAEKATSDLIEEGYQWVRSETLPVEGSCVYSPHVGINFDRDYQLFLHARTDILELCAEIERHKKIN